MSEQRKTEITVGTAVAEWSDEIVAQWNVLGDTIARSLQQQTKLEQAHGQQERSAHVREIERLRAALAESETKATASMREFDVRLDATRREYEMKVALLQQELEQRGRPVERPHTAVAAPTERTEWEGPVDSAESEWRTDSPERPWGSLPANLRSALGERWSRMRSGPYLIPVIGFLAGLAVMVSLYPLLHRPAAPAAKEILNVRQPVKEAPTATGRPLAAASAAPPVVKGDATPGRSYSSPVSSSGSTQLAAPGGYAVLLAGGKLLTPDKPGAPSAVYEAQLAIRAGYDSVSVYQRNDRYMTAVLFSSREEAERGLQSINADFDSRWKKTSSIVPVGEWCRVKGAMESVIVNGTQVAVWSCNKTSS